MTDDEMIANHIVVRQGVFQYLRCVPEDLRHEFPFARIQRSLRTRDKRVVREAALEHDREWERRFAEARLRRGTASDDTGSIARIDTTCWSWPDWEALAVWFRLTLANEDWQALPADCCQAAQIQGTCLGVMYRLLRNTLRVAKLSPR